MASVDVKHHVYLLTIQPVPFREGRRETDRQRQTDRHRQTDTERGGETETERELTETELSLIHI